MRTPRERILSWREAFSADGCDSGVIEGRVGLCEPQLPHCTQAISTCRYAQGYIWLYHYDASFIWKTAYRVKAKKC